MKQIYLAYCYEAGVGSATEHSLTVLGAFSTKKQAEAYITEVYENDYRAAQRVNHKISTGFRPIIDGAMFNMVTWSDDIVHCYGITKTKLL